jgi:hypothetical protein
MMAGAPSPGADMTMCVLTVEETTRRSSAVMGERRGESRGQESLPSRARVCLDTVVIIITHDDWIGMSMVLLLQQGWESATGTLGTWN